MSAYLIPIQFLGPAENGMYAYGCRFNTFSAKKLSGLKIVASNFQYCCFRCKHQKSKISSVPSGIITSPKIECGEKICFHYQKLKHVRIQYIHRYIGCANSNNYRAKLALKYANLTHVLHYMYIDHVLEILFILCFFCFKIPVIET